jgi:hypothetical protein
MHNEFAAAAVEHQTVVEINIGANLMNPQYPASFAKQYLDYLAGLQAQGVRLSIGSDCHDKVYQPDIELAAEMLASVGIRGQDLWRFPPRQG